MITITMSLFGTSSKLSRFSTPKTQVQGYVQLLQTKFKALQEMKSDRDTKRSLSIWQYKIYYCSFIILQPHKWYIKQHSKQYILPSAHSFISVIQLSNCWSVMSISVFMVSSFCNWLCRAIVAFKHKWQWEKTSTSSSWSSWCVQREATHTFLFCYRLYTCMLIYCSSVICRRQF